MAMYNSYTIPSEVLGYLTDIIQDMLFKKIHMVLKPFRIR